MQVKVSRVDTWTAVIEDRAGGVADKLEPLAKAGANFEFVLARRTPERARKGIVFVTPVKGAKVLKAARAAGFARPKNIHTLRVEGKERARRRGEHAACTGKRGNQFSSARGDVHWREIRRLSRARHGRRCCDSHARLEKAALIATGLD